MSDELFPGVEADPPAVPAEGEPPAGPEWLPETLRGNEFLHDYESADQALSELAALKAARASGDMGDFVRITDDPKEMERVYTKLGKPESPEKYGFERPEGFDDKVDPEKVTAFTKLAHEANFTQSQYEKVMGFVGELVSVEEELANNVTALTEIWGAEDSDQFKANQRLANAGFNALKDPVVIEAVNADPTLRSNPAFLQTLKYIGQQLQDDVPGKTTVAKSQTFEGADPSTKISAFREKNAAVINNPMHPEHAKKIEELLGLHAEKAGISP